MALSTSSYSTVVSYANDAKLACSDTDAATKLRMPCSGWKFTSTWTALQQADAQLYDGTYTSHTKVVIIITDGAPERNNNQGDDYRRARPTYLAVRQAKLLKDKGAVILAVGYSSKFTGSGGNFGPCHPICTGMWLALNRSRPCLQSPCHCCCLDALTHRPPLGPPTPIRLWTRILRRERRHWAHPFHSCRQFASRIRQRWEWCNDAQHVHVRVLGESATGGERELVEC